MGVVLHAYNINNRYILRKDVVQASDKRIINYQFSIINYLEVGNHQTGMNSSVCASCSYNEKLSL